MVEESVSRQHAFIEFDRSTRWFTLVDTGSTTGTFLKVPGQLHLCKNMVVELGSYQFLVADCKANGQSGELHLTIIEENAPKKDIVLQAYPNTMTFGVGRRESNALSFNDVHMSSEHARFLYLRGSWWL